MEFEHHEEEEEEEPTDHTVLTPSYDDSLGNSFANRSNSFKKMSQSLFNMDISSQSRKLPKYKECLKNHAVGLGATAVDGCGEFMPAGEEGTLDALKCAACTCHRNFHRKETDPFPLLTSPPPLMEPQPFGFHQYPHGPHFSPPGYFRATPSSSIRPQKLLLLPSSSGGGRMNNNIQEHHQEDVLNMENNSMGSGGLLVKKRHRTKFSQEQKEKMLELAERLGWRMQKADEEIVKEFCNEFGIKRHVLKVWMHNNKLTLGKKEGTITTPPPSAS